MKCQACRRHRRQCVFVGAESCERCRTVGINCGEKTIIRRKTRLETVGYGKDSIESKVLRIPEQLHLRLVGESLESLTLGQMLQLNLPKLPAVDIADEVRDILSLCIPSLDAPTIQASIEYAFTAFDHTINPTPTEPVFSANTPPSLADALFSEDGSSISSSPDVRKFSFAFWHFPVLRNHPFWYRKEF